MSLVIYESLEQGTDEWLAARAGLVTASVVGKLITPSLKLADNETSRGLIETLAAERITGHVDFVFPNADMQRGTMDEPYCRDIYAANYAPVTEVGFMRLDTDDYSLGFSPDGAVAADGLIEIKSRRPRIQMHTILSGSVPMANRAQIQAGLFVSGREWLDFISYAGGWHMYVERVYPDPKWFEVIHEAATKAEKDITDLIARYEVASLGLILAERVDHFADIEIGL